STVAMVPLALQASEACCCGSTGPEPSTVVMALMVRTSAVCGAPEAGPAPGVAGSASSPLRMATKATMPATTTRPAKIQKRRAFMLGSPVRVVTGESSQRLSRNYRDIAEALARGGAAVLSCQPIIL